MELKLEYGGVNNTVDIELDNFSMKTKMVVKPGNIAILFDEKSFFSTPLCFNPHWDCKFYIEYLSQKFINLSTIDKIHLESDNNDGSAFKRCQTTNTMQFRSRKSTRV